MLLSPKHLFEMMARWRQDHEAGKLFTEYLGHLELQGAETYYMLPLQAGGPISALITPIS